MWDIGTAVNEISAAMARFVTKAPPVNFDADYLRVMKALLAPWLTSAVHPAPPGPLIARSGPPDPVTPKSAPPSGQVSTTATTTSLRP